MMVTVTGIVNTVSLRRGESVEVELTSHLSDLEDKGFVRIHRPTRKTRKSPTKTPVGKTRKPRKTPTKTRKGQSGGAK